MGFKYSDLSLTWKFLLPALIALVVGTAASTAITYSVAKGALEEELRASISTTADEMKIAAEDFMEARKREMSGWSKEKLFVTALDPGFLGKSARKSSKDRLAELLQEYPFYKDIYLVMKSGEVAVAGSDAQTAVVFSQESFFRQALNGETVHSSVILDPESNEPMVYRAVPMMADDGIHGVFIGAVDLDVYYERYVAPVKVGASGYGYVTDSEGVFILHPNPDFLLQRNVQEFGVQHAFKGDTEGYEEYDFQGTMKATGYVISEILDWVFFASGEIDELYQDITRLGWISILIAVLITVALGAIIWTTLRYAIIRPVQRATDVVVKVSKGNLQHRVGITNNDEVGRLSKALDGYCEVLAEFVGLLKEIADGDLSRDMPTQSAEDELADAGQRMVEGIRALVRAAGETADQVGSGADQVSDSSQSLSQGATEQAASLEEINSSMQEIGSQTKAGAENAAQAEQLASEARKVAADGKDEMDNMVTAMNEINDSAQAIGKIIKVIDEIAFQTNLLALNAAVEAARAGRHGKGFAVVAEEVRNLAGRSAKAAGETAELIEGSMKKVERGNSIAASTAQALENINVTVSKAADLVGEIAAASNEQAQGIAQVNQGLGQVDQVTQQNTANAEQTASAAQELAQLAAQLKSVLARFSLNEGSHISVSTHEFEHDAMLANSRELPEWDDSVPSLPQGDNE